MNPLVCRHGVLSALAFCMLSLTAATSALAQGAKTGKPVPSANGIVITGDREGPLGLHIAPWQEPAAILPEALIQSRLPKVFDDPRSLAEDSVNRQFPPIETASAPAPSEKKENRPSRRGRPKDEVPNANLMQSKP
jgi:hypothetical protein